MPKKPTVFNLASNNPWLPDYLTESVLNLTPEVFKNIGVTHLIFDIDETLMPKNGMILTQEYQKHINKLRQSGLEIFIGSNATRDLSPIAQSIEAIIIPPTKFSFKPFKSYFRRISQATNVLPEETAMIGDRILNDVVGANRAGYYTFLVDAVTRRPAWWNKHYLNWAMRHVVKS